MGGKGRRSRSRPRSQDRHRSKDYYPSNGGKGDSGGKRGPQNYRQPEYAADYEARPHPRHSVGYQGPSPTQAGGTSRAAHLIHELQAINQQHLEEAQASSVLQRLAANIGFPDCSAYSSPAAPAVLSNPSSMPASPPTWLGGLIDGLVGKLGPGTNLPSASSSVAGDYTPGPAPAPAPLNDAVSQELVGLRQQVADMRREKEASERQRLQEEIASLRALATPVKNSVDPSAGGSSGNTSGDAELAAALEQIEATRRDLAASRGPPGPPAPTVTLAAGTVMNSAQDALVADVATWEPSSISITLREQKLWISFTRPGARGGWSRAPLTLDAWMQKEKGCLDGPTLQTAFTKAGMGVATTITRDIMTLRLLSKLVREQPEES
ncbi:unnamed protein product [Polarella glacialis]|uniref:Uncharacterized protein n=1 Tax=Polarella glacialis TaxID=89957 RepID=A0A813G8C8_POLGL|nr:unnamed protein product [Polarella glacialis]